MIVKISKSTVLLLLTSLAILVAASMFFQWRHVISVCGLPLPGASGADLDECVSYAESGDFYATRRLPLVYTTWYQITKDEKFLRRGFFWTLSAVRDGDKDSEKALMYTFDNSEIYPSGLQCQTLQAVLRGGDEASKRYVLSRISARSLCIRDEAG